MNFTEIEFWPRLLAGLLLIFSLRFFLSKDERTIHRFDRCALAALSLFLLASVGFLTTAIFAAVFTLAWAMVILMMKFPHHQRKYVLWVGIPILCGPLIYYKYRVFLIQGVLGLENITFEKLAIPAGISFYTFQKVAMLIDASRMKEWKPKFLDYINFASFFPQVVAGPIERRGSLFPQVENFRFKLVGKHLNQGAPWIALGFFYKLCLADNLSTFIDKDAMASAWPIVLCTILFGLKIYFDFCGYSLIALGLAKCLGIDLTLNFTSPYWSGSIREFWRRWHISLSYWFRDYIYIPMGGGKSKHWWFNLLAVFILSGIWHGAGWGFLIWGALHGSFSVISHYFKGKFRLPWLLGWPITTMCVFIAWLPFYETRTGILWEKVRILCTPHAWTFSSFTSFFASYDSGRLLAMSAAILLCLTTILLEGICRIRGKSDYSHAGHPLTTAFCIASVVVLGAIESNDFVYFSF